MVEVILVVSCSFGYGSSGMLPSEVREENASQEGRHES